MASSDESRLVEMHLMQRCFAGDGRAFQTLTERYYRPVRGFLYKRVQRLDVVEDLAQDTFLEAFREIKLGQQPGCFSSWLFGIAHNISGKWLRRKRPMLFDPAHSPESPVEPDFLAREEQEEQEKRLLALNAELANLPEEIRQVLEMKHSQGRTCEQIAAELGRPTGTIKCLLSRTYKTLRSPVAPGRGGRFMKVLTCAAVEDLLDLFAANECDSHDGKAVRAHVAGCPTCQGKLAEARQLMGLLDLHHRAEPALARLKQRLEAEVPTRPVLLQWRPVVRRLTAVAALLLVLFGLGVMLPTLSDRSTPPRLELALLPQSEWMNPDDPGAAIMGNLRKRGFEAAIDSDPPLPPRVNLVLVLRNPELAPLVVSYDDFDVRLTLHGPGVRREKGHGRGSVPGSMTIPARGERSLVLERLESRDRGETSYLYPLQSGEYTVSVELRVWAWPAGLPDERRRLIVTSRPMKLRLEANR